MKKYILLILSIICTLSLISCGGPLYEVKNESPVPPGLQKYAQIHIGWIDLNENDWKTFGYESKDQWRSAIADLNTNHLKYYIKEFLKGKNLSYARSKIDVISPSADLYINFTNTIVEKTWTPMGSGKTSVDKINTTINFIDTKTKTVIYQADISSKSACWKGRSSGKGFDFATPSIFENRLGWSLCNIADVIANKLE